MKQSSLNKDLVSNTAFTNAANSSSTLTFIDYLYSLVHACRLVRLASPTVLIVLINFVGKMIMKLKLTQYFFLTVEC